LEAKSAKALKLLEMCFPADGNNQVVIDQVLYANILKIAGCVNYSKKLFDESYMHFEEAKDQFK
jgi:hypothetical protein